MTVLADQNLPNRRRIAAQGALLFTGFGAAQALSFVRNAIIGHALSKGDFGIAAAITLTLQTVETLSDLGADRMIVQTDDGASKRFLAASHLVLAVRGLLLGLVLYALGPYAARAFGAPQASALFQMVALVPVIKGFLHLDFRIAQRRFDNWPNLMIEVGPQAVALLLTVPALWIYDDYSVVIALACAQAIAATLLSHAMAKQPYRLAFDGDVLMRQLRFGWPILASALPLVAVYQGDRMIVANLLGVEALASYTVAFMATMVPAVITAKVGHALMLPIFSDAVRDDRPMLPAFKFASELTAASAAIYLAVFIVCGDHVVPLVFGNHYHHLGPLIGWLSGMWALRMMQAAPGMALMARAQTRPFAVAGFIRALALPCVAMGAAHSMPLAHLAAIGCAFEALSLAYIVARLATVERGLAGIVVSRAAFLIPAAALAVVAQSGADLTFAQSALIACSVAAVLAVAAVWAMPALNGLARRLLRDRRSQPAA